MDESIRLKVESPPSPAGNSITEEDNGIFYTPIPRDRIVPTSTWDTDDYTPSLVYPQGPIFGPYDPKTSPDYRHEPSLFDIRCRTMIDETKFADTEGKFNGGIKTALVWDGTCHRVCPTLEVGGPFRFEYSFRKRKIRPPTQLETNPEIRTEPDNDYRVRMSDIPQYREGQRDDPYSVRPVETQHRRAFVRVRAPEQREEALQTKIEDDAMALDEGVPQVSIKLENTQPGHSQPAPAKSEFRDAPVPNLSYGSHYLPRAGIEVGNVSQASTLESQSLESPMLDVSRIPHHVEQHQVQQIPGASEPQSRPEPTPKPRPENITIKREEMTAENTDQLEKMDIDSEQHINEAPATSTLPERIPLGITIMNVMSMLNESQASSSGPGPGTFVDRIVDLRDQQRSPAGTAQDSHTIKTQEGTANAIKPAQYHYPQPKTTGRRIAQPKPTAKATPPSAGAVNAGKLTDLRLRRSAASLIDLFEKETQTGSYAPEGGVQMDADYDSVEEEPTKKSKPNMRRRKKAKEVKEAARVRASEDAQSEADMQALYAYAGIVPGESSSELSMPSDSTQSLIDPTDAPTRTKSNYNHPSQHLVIRDADPVPDIALCRAGESIADARARLGLPPRAKKEKALPPRAE